MVVDAPGKIVVLGEYAVVDGAPAVVRAVDRGVRCVVSPSPVRHWTTPTGDDRFVARALDAVDAPAAHYTFTDWRPVESTEKVGLGGSAAATVAAVVAAWRQAGRDVRPDEVFGAAFAVHHAVQGSGSGIDVAASAYGGWIRFEAGSIVSLPEGPACAIVYSGTSASTGPRVKQYLDLPEHVRSAFVRASAEQVAAFNADPLGAVIEGKRLLRTMTDRAGIAYWTPGIEALVNLAEARGGAAKPSGAGGGDIVVGVFADPERTAAWTSAARAAGFLPIPVSTSRGATESNLRSG